jgi:predicted  nucleic acid-binding Zn-ribbon protein
LTKLSAGGAIYDLRKKIQQIQADLSQLGDPVSEIPELITSANLLRSNEYLSKANEKKTELLSAYEQYSMALEELLSFVFEIQHDLKEILKTQSSMIPSHPKK